MSADVSLKVEPSRRSDLLIRTRCRMRQRLNSERKHSHPTAIGELQRRWSDWLVQINKFIKLNAKGPVFYLMLFGANST